jgi:tetratricopeptide (TPR) repeat protein
VVLGDGIRARSVAERAFELYLDRGWVAAEAKIASAPARLAAEAWAQLGVALENEERTDDARRALQRSRQLAPERTDTLLFLADLERDAGEYDAAIDHYRSLLAAAPGAMLQALELARLLADREAHGEIIELLTPFRAHASIEVRLRLARALFETERYADVIAVVGPVVKDAERELHNIVHRELRNELVAQRHLATDLHDDAYAHLHGREQVIEADVHRGRLDARSGANFRLLGEARMVDAPPWTPDTALRDLDGTAAHGEALIANGEKSRGLCHLGVAALRRHKTSEARNRFEAARDLDDRNFAAYLGIGAAIDHDKLRAVQRVRRLPEPPESLPAVLGQILVDWPSLTPDERACVHAAVAPLAAQLPAVAAAGGIARVLPIDARLIDLPEFAEDAGVRLDDARCLDAITGASSARLCASKVEELLNFSGDAGWVFAHELAHLVHFHLPEDRCAQLDALFAELAASEFVLTTYQTRNTAEFFAVAYEDYLANLYSLPSTREAGFEYLEPVFAFIDSLVV